MASTNDLVEASKGVDRSYSFTSPPEMPITNILVPSLENAMPRGLLSCSDTEVASTNDLVEASKGVDRSYSFTSPPILPPSTNILAPSLENAMSCGAISCADMEVVSTNVLVEASKGADSAYSFTPSPAVPITNILVPSFENAMPVGMSACARMRVASTNDLVEASKGVDRSYSFTSSPVLPITNILVPSFENAMPRGELSCDMEVVSTNFPVEASNVLTMRLPDSSRTAPGSIVSSGVASPATAARCGAVRVNDTVAPSASVSSSPALRVVPCV